MTASSRGITHYIKGVNEFIKIDDWMIESKLFEKLGKIQFFKEYKLWKNFFHWQKQSRRTVMNKCKKVLEKNLFILDPLLQSDLIQI